ncbi:MAG: hypothetical protein GY861_06910 [bacterium]|nr:hypothetical protein [bacterium]
MVKKLISGVLGKKEDSKEEAKDSVPDELPSLAEDSAPAAPADAAKPEEAGPPDELPTVDAPVEESAQPVEAASQTAPMPERKGVLKPEEHEGYFSSVLKMAKEHGEARERVISEDVFRRMKESWDSSKKKKTEEGTPSLTSGELDAKIRDKARQLEHLETTWRMQKRVLEEDEKLLGDKEDEIQKNIDEFKELMKEMRFVQNVSPDKFLLLKNGAVIKNLDQMAHILKKIDPVTFRFHCSGRKNDFSSWAAQIDSSIAIKLRTARDKKDMIRILTQER